MPPIEQNRQDYNERFLATLEGLNTVQKQAVDQIDGPVLVVAGPGTGKTHILAARIGRILLETDAQPNNILCLTFTDAGVIAMRDRLLTFIGPEAHRVHINTFHSFCNAIIQDNLELFGKQDMEPLSELDRIDLIRNILDRLPMDHALRLGISDIYFYENHLYQLFQQMKMEDWSVEYIHQQIDFYLEDLPNNKAFVYQRRSGTNQKGDLKEAKVEDAIIRMNKLRAAADLYPIYEQAKFDARRYDYSDMILWVLRAFEKEKTLLQNYQEQYLYILVDEYQDTNGSQNELIQYLASYWEIPNLFIVGDDDQSIYEFQGARLKNLTDIYERYQEHIQLLVLEQNYRSTQHILDASRQLIDRNQLRIINKIEGKTIAKVLQASHPDRREEQVAIQVQEFPNRQQEIVAIVESIKAAQEQGFPLEEVAVIYARHQQIEQLKLLLQKQSIPFQTRRRINVLDTPLIQKILQLLRYFNLEIRHAFSGESLLFEILHFDFLELDSQAITDLSLSRAAVAWDQQAPWRKAIQTQHGFLSFSKVLEGLLKDSVNFSLPTFVERMYNRLPILAYNLQADHALEQVQLLVSFLNFVKEEHRKRPNLTIEELLKVIQRMQRNRIILPIDAGLDIRKGVQLITAHSAKGLEFEKVFLLDVVKKEWEPQSRGSRFQFTLPDTLTLSGEADELEARRRLFYVAMTRAKRELICSYARFDQKNRPLQRALFVDELMDAQGIAFTERELDVATLMKSQILQIQSQEEVYIPAQDKATIDALLHPFKLSISAMNTYLRCPLSFYYTYVVKAPGLMSEAAAYGTAMHNALQRLFLNMQRSKPRQFPAQRVFIKYFDQEMDRLQMYFTPDAYLQRLEKGRHLLKQYYQQHYGSWHKRVVVEYTIRTAEVEGVPMTGTIDKLEFGKQQKVHIVDYKTGSHRAEKLRRPTERKPLGGIYWRQLVFYKLLYENFDQTGRIAKSAEIAYLDPDKNGTFITKSIEFELNDTQVVRDLIKDTYAKIKAHDFYEGCNEPDCHWCNFVKNHQLPEQIAEPIIEEMDD